MFWWDSSPFLFLISSIIYKQISTEVVITSLPNHQIVMSVMCQPFPEPAVPHASAAQVLCQSNLNALGAESGEFSVQLQLYHTFFHLVPKCNQKSLKLSDHNIRIYEKCLCTYKLSSIASLRLQYFWSCASKTANFPWGDNGLMYLWQVELEPTLSSQCNLCANKVLWQKYY